DPVGGAPTGAAEAAALPLPESCRAMFSLARHLVRVVVAAGQVLTLYCGFHGSLRSDQRGVSRRERTVDVREARRGPIVVSVHEGDHRLYDDCLLIRAVRGSNVRI